MSSKSVIHSYGLPHSPLTPTLSHPCPSSIIWHRMLPNSFHRLLRGSHCVRTLLIVKNTMSSPSSPSSQRERFGLVWFLLLVVYMPSRRYPGLSHQFGSRRIFQLTLHPYQAWSPCYQERLTVNKLAQPIPDKVSR